VFGRSPNPSEPGVQPRVGSNFRTFRIPSQIENANQTPGHVNNGLRRIMPVARELFRSDGIADTLVLIFSSSLYLCDVISIITVIVGLVTRFTLPIAQSKIIPPKSSLRPYVGADRDTIGAILRHSIEPHLRRGIIVTTLFAQRQHGIDAPLRQFRCQDTDPNVYTCDANCAIRRLRRIARPDVRN